MTNSNLKTHLRNESILTSIIQFLGVGIGIVSTIFVYPKDLNLYGAYGFLTNTASLLVPFISLGFGSVLIKYFPAVRQDVTKKSQFFQSVLFHYLIGIVVFSLLFFLSFYFVKKSFITDDIYFQRFYIYVLPLTVLYVIYDLFSSYCINFLKLSFPMFLSSLMKIYLPITFLACIYGFLNTSLFPLYICIFYLIALYILFLYLKKQDNFQFKLSSNLSHYSQNKSVYQFAFYSILGGTGSALALRLDSFMITKMLGTEANGIYSLAFFISNSCYIPANAISLILEPRVAALSHEGDHDKLNQYYKKSASIMITATILISGSIIFGLPILFKIMPNHDKVVLLAPALVFLLLSRIIDSATGVNAAILSYSKYYKWEAYLMLLMAGLNILFNYFLIPEYGISGAAIATCMSVFLFNLAKSILIYFTLKLSPISSQLIWILLVGFGLFVMFYYFNFHEDPIINTLIKLTVFNGSFLSIIFAFDLNKELKEYVLDKVLWRK